MHGPGSGHGPRPFRLRAVLFDFDGTLTRPDALDFPAIKREIGCPADSLVLEWIEALPPGTQRDSALATLERFELDAAAESVPNADAERVIRGLRAQGLKVGVLTRNGLSAVRRALSRFRDLDAGDLDVIVTRDDRIRPKPAPDGVRHAAAAMGVPPEETLVVGDFILDVQAGRAAGALTAYLTNGDAEGPSGNDAHELGRPEDADCDFVVQGLADLDDVVRLGVPLPHGKLPNELLGRYLRGLAPADRSVLVPAGIGEDVTALDIAGADTLVAHGDPITLSSRRLAEYAVLVNANDIAASGGVPRWLLTTVLLPAGTTASEALALLADLGAAATSIGVALVGGHTEVSDAFTRPVVSATMLGTMCRADLRDKRQVQTGDQVILTKALAVEGTALLAEELGERLRALGMGERELAACGELLGLMSIVPEARLAAGFAGVRGMHDVTEGGLATALCELAVACGHGIVVHHERVPLLPETRRLCGLLGADPLGLIASGSLLICCRPDETEHLLEALAGEGIAATVIGEVSEVGAGVRALARGLPAPWPKFAADEAARLLAKPGAEDGHPPGGVE
ncbi:MAG: HAD-IA family hydrolase [Actinobacteria bacterium]|nr:HAD-IA family hydrolase [Actinomycetota bacterium]